MVKKEVKRIIALILALVLSASPAFAQGITAQDETDQKQSDQEPNTSPYAMELLDGFDKIADNGSRELYLNPQTLGIQVREKSSGQIFSSFAGSAEGMNETWQNFMYSGVTLEYMGTDMKLTRLPFAGSGASASVTATAEGFLAQITFKEGFALDLEVTLDGNRLSVHVPDESIVEPEDGKMLQSIYIYPFLGATYGTGVPGYLFLPDGCGALIRTDVKSVATSGTYSKRIYGQEMGVGDFSVLTERSMLRPAEQIYMPVYGIAQKTGAAAVTAIVAQGDAYSTIEACVSGRELPVNYVTAKFLMRETYTRSLNQAGATMVANQPLRNHTDILEHYYFLTGGDATYVGMAATYQDYLVAQGVFTDEPAHDQGQIPMMTQILLSEQAPEMIGTSTVMMTTMDQADGMLRELYDAGIGNMSVILNGYSPKGAQNAAPASADFMRKVGTASDWKAFIEKWQALGVEPGFYADFVHGYDLAGGFSKRTDVAQNINEKLLESYGYSSYYFLAPQYIQEKLSREAEDFKITGTQLLALDGVGYCLYSNWNKKSASSRGEAKEIYENLETDGLRTAYFTPSSYVWKNAHEIYHISSTSSKYMVFTDTVPFMQMVLKGYVDYYASPSNFHADTKKDMLKMIEYGEYPSWILTHEDSIELFSTPSAWVYTSCFSIWKDEIIRQYMQINDALAPVMDAHMTGREVLSEDVVSVTYDNGVVITVNYGSSDYISGDLTVKALSYAVSGVK